MARLHSSMTRKTDLTGTKTAFKKIQLSAETQTPAWFSEKKQQAALNAALAAVKEYKKQKGNIKKCTNMA